MKDKKLATEIAEERMSMIAPCCPRTWTAARWRSSGRRSVSAAKFPKGPWNGI
ncbi:MAG: hypothetical protein MR762_06785 [Clostridiales bacterium]|nr:hypothetical protein [Clostridiales bacterium]MCI7019333.1 hypothetical protein [Clostridiales bacterium]